MNGMGVLMFFVMAGAWACSAIVFLAFLFLCSNVSKLRKEQEKTNKQLEEFLKRIG